ncbi:MAG: trehalose-phosphatase [Anaerolineales bacterium]
MTHWKQATGTLAMLAGASRFGLFSDLDGTLAPISPTPKEAQLSPRGRHLLSALRDELPLLALISGRRAASLAKKAAVPGLIYIGNHGLEQWENEQTAVLPEALPYLPNLQAAKAELQALERDGAFVEDKHATLSFHYRQVPQPEEFAARSEAQIAEVVAKHGLILFTGKRVFEVRPPIDMDKGIAFRNLVETHRLETALFIGDDVSDLNALHMARQMRKDQVCDAWGIGVQSEDAPDTLADVADFLADGVADVEALLAWLLTARKASST